MTLPPLGLYVHIPWCVRKCPYCDFNSHAANGELPETDYVSALLRDFSSEAEAIQGRPIETIFIGGGTPSLFSANALGILLKGLQQQCEFAPDIEITLEANPGTTEHHRFQDYRAIGINRLSIGVQSFDDLKLQTLGRIHSSDQAIKAFSQARQADFRRINLDLMFGLPGQSPEQALQDLQQAISLQPDHISWYQLTIEPNTEFYSKPPQLPADDNLWVMQQQGLKHLLDAGYLQYETSAYARANQQCRHNLNYWRFGDFIGIGAGAHGKLTSPQGAIVRNWKTRMPSQYLAREQDFTAGQRRLESAELPLEFMMNALRLSDGVERSLFTERTGLPISRIDQPLQQAEAKGLFENLTRLQPSERGRLFLNDLLELFLP
ncbi:radical SAM family heme chaperone HemW [Aestuariirhabdus sp. Z084]|uniref:radical SAM family heme chaperone HemW n=1 Tax=Aestuariirhabdus haliotis TaxID=2918751 RepID=UPI00201B3FDD|nr:radical SAM family heme chaperone HemW [Aestuariirhabdus haliotis]MCL6414153.1 radical SAM family heme chaperone HemW [Aestuariirhabdus haliotis]MCL6418085.1 radical SAM family heme chaperone HemW [Aestuariirhabdus haliotis]